MSSSDPTTSTTPLAPSYYIDTSNNSSGHFYQPLALSRVFALLVKMVDILQKTAAAQANRLNVLSNWQAAYTDEMNQVHAFISNNGDAHPAGTRGVAAALPYGSTTTGTQTTQNVGYNHWLDSSSDSESSTIRTDLNTQNTSFTQLMQGDRQVISDDAKSLQTSVNQSNDAVQSQTDIATSILQQLSTILTSIFQS